MCVSIYYTACYELIPVAPSKPCPCYPHPVTLGQHMAFLLTS